MSQSRTSLGEVCEIIAGQHIEAALYSDIPTGSPYLTGPADFGELRPLVSKWTHAPKVFAKEGDVLVTVKGNGVGKINLGCDAAIGRQLMALRPRSGRLIQSFLYHHLRAWELRIAKIAQGATVPGIGKSDLAELQLVVPPLAEQKRIADILDRAEALRASRRAALALLDTLPQAIFIEMFGDPVTNPEEWTVRVLSELGSLDRGVSTHRPRNAPQLLGGPHPLVQTGEVANCEGYVREYSSTYSDIGLKQSKLWPAGTLCITIAANIAKGGILTFPACFPDSVVGFRSEEPATVEYVRVWLTFLQKRLEDAAPESAQKNINLGLLRTLRIPTPPLPLQQEFARRVAAVEGLRASQRASLAKLDELFASLQHRAFRGEL